MIVKQAVVDGQESTKLVEIEFEETQVNLYFDTTPDRHLATCYFNIKATIDELKNIIESHNKLFRKEGGDVKTNDKER